VFEAGLKHCQVNASAITKNAEALISSPLCSLAGRGLSEIAVGVGDCYQG
jgi:hypothetical protein